VPLLFRGRFDYSGAGILDRTHLHFYYRDSAIQLARDAGLEVEKGLFAGLDGPRSRGLDRLSCGLLRNRLARQFIFAARRSSCPRRPRIKWRVAI
jgi:hypothetical protein